MCVMRDFLILEQVSRFRPKSGPLPVSDPARGLIKKFRIYVKILNFENKVQESVADETFGNRRLAM